MTTAPPRRSELGALGLAVLCVAQFVDVMSLNAAVVALPEIRGDLDMGTASAQWVISGYALLFSGWGAPRSPPPRSARRAPPRRTAASRPGRARPRGLTPESRRPAPLRWRTWLALWL